MDDRIMKSGTIAEIIGKVTKVKNVNPT